MNIDITNLQALPELDAAATGLKGTGPKPCTNFTRIICVKPTCRITKVSVAL